MNDVIKYLGEALIIGIINELRVIELYSQCLKHDISMESREAIEAVIKAKERHMAMLTDMFEKKLKKKLDISKLKDVSLKQIKSLELEPISLHLLDIALGYEHREKEHFEETKKAFNNDTDVKALFSKLSEEGDTHITLIEKERKAVRGLPYIDFELDFYVRE